jgi:hypothetical protein
MYRHQQATADEALDDSTGESECQQLFARNRPVATPGSPLQDFEDPR